MTKITIPLYEYLELLVVVESLQHLDPVPGEVELLQVHQLLQALVNHTRIHQISVASATLLDFYFFSLTTLMIIFYRAHTVVHTIFCLGYCLVGVGLMWTWSLFLHWSRIDEFVLGLKSVDELCHSPPMGIDTSQLPKGEICMDKSLKLPSNPARQ